MQNPVHVTVIALLVMILFGGALYARKEAQQDFPVVVRATYEPYGGGNLPDVEETHVRLRNAQALVDQTLRNPLRRPEGIEVCPFVESGIALRVADDEDDGSTVRDCTLSWSTDRFFDLERARLEERARQLATTEE